MNEHNGERDVTLDDLAERHPEAAQDVEQTEVQTPEEKASKSLASWAIRTTGQVGIGLGAGFALIWALHWMPFLGP